MRSWLRAPVRWRDFGGHRIFADSVTRGHLLEALVLLAVFVLIGQLYGSVATTLAGVGAFIALRISR